MNINRRKLRKTFGSRTTRRMGVKSSGKTKPSTLLKALIRKIEGEVK